MCDCLLQCPWSELYVLIYLWFFVLRELGGKLSILRGLWTGLLRYCDSICVGGGGRYFCIYHNVKTGSGAHLVCCSLGKGTLLLGWCGWGMKLTTHVCWVPRLILCRALSPFPHTPICHVWEQCLFFWMKASRCACNAICVTQIYVSTIYFILKQGYLFRLEVSHLPGPYNIFVTRCFAHFGIP